MFDCHYYLSQELQELKRASLSQKMRVLVVGGDFSSAPSSNLLPMREGSYKVYPGDWTSHVI